ncbi:biotin-dependent carboxyltransferase family protein [Singulisphaera sp. Ch08]|uniref:Biotin-dependent carboxyltransferase family protein n=1 Tax=Singulisphaera sp. Ch08 TaxID=3120278 RepID=A0AAU7CCV2_9BACT
MGLLILSPGHFTTIQDRGRSGFREWGVPCAGAFDRDAFEIANGLLGNSPDSATLEMTLFGGSYEAQIPLAIALAGAPMETSLIDRDGAERPLTLPLSCSMKPGERLRIGGASLGARTYLAVRGGWQTNVRLGSRAEETRLHSGVTLAAQPGATLNRHPRFLPWCEPAKYPIRVVDGPDANRVGSLEEWLGTSFRVTGQCDRMGLRIAGTPLHVRTAAEPLSIPVAPGSIQVAGGQMLILGVNCGTMGGYPVVAHIISADLARIGQLREGDRLVFQRVDLVTARALDREYRRKMREIVQRLAALAADPEGDRTSL